MTCRAASARKLAAVFLLAAACGGKNAPPSSPANATGGGAANTTTGGSGGQTGGGSPASGAGGAASGAGSGGAGGAPSASGGSPADAMAASGRDANAPFACGTNVCPGAAPSTLADGTPYHWAACCVEGSGCGMSSAGGPCQRLLYDREQRGVRYLRVSERGLYWYESTIGAGPRILRAPKDGSAEPEPFANVGAAVTIASDATHVYWIEFAKGITQAMRLSHDGGTPEPIPLGLTFDYPVMGEIDGDHVNIGDSSCLHIARVSTATLEVTTLRDQQGMLGGGGTVVAADDGTVYCAGSPEAGTENGQLIAVPKRGGDAQTMAEGIFEGIQHVEGWLYVIADRREHDARLERIATSGGSVEVVDEPGRGVANPGSGLRYDAARRMLYWRIGNDVRRYSVANGEAVDVLACRGSSLESDSDTAFLYEEDPWEQNPSSRIWAVPLSTLATWEDTFARWPDDASYGSRAGMIRCP